MAEVAIVGLIDEGKRVDSIAARNIESPDEYRDQQLVTDQSPFYGESGGQVGDTGTIKTTGGEFRVNDTQKNGGILVHFGYVSSGSVSSGDKAQATVDDQSRSAIRRAHTATHILHHSLQQELGSHAQQRGSKVTADWLRFDFTNLSPVESEQLSKIESESKARVKESSKVTAETLPLAEAKGRGAMMLFGEKYPDPVRMISIGEFSKELCGGTHVANSSEIGQFEIVSEEGVSAGTRRIVAITGEKAHEYREQIQSVVDAISKELGCSKSQIKESVGALANHIKKAKKLISGGGGELALLEFTDQGDQPEYLELRSALRQTANDLNCPLFEVGKRVQAMHGEAAKLRQQLDKLKDAPKMDADSLLETAESIGDIKVIAAELANGNPNLMRGLIDQIRKKTNPSAIFLAAAMGEDKVMLVAGFSRDLVEQGYHAGNWVKEVAPKVGGGGGGKPDLAQAGGKDPGKIGEALEAAKEFIRSAPVG